MPKSGHAVGTATSGEVRVTDPETGGQKGQKPEQYSLIPKGPLAEVARLYGRGAEKYARNNWAQGYDWHLSFDALMRHAWAFWGGEDVDPETRCHHLSSVVFHAFSLMEFGDTHPEKDDRPTQEREDAAERGLLPKQDQPFGRPLVVPGDVVEIQNEVGNGWKGVVCQASPGGGSFRLTEASYRPAAKDDWQRCGDVTGGYSRDKWRRIG